MTKDKDLEVFIIKNWTFKRWSINDMDNQKYYIIQNQIEWMVLIDKDKYKIKHYVRYLINQMWWYDEIRILKMVLIMTICIMFFVFLAVYYMYQTNTAIRDISQVQKQLIQPKEPAKKTIIDKVMDNGK